MLITSLDRLGDWNPQLLRELQGRLTKRNMAIVSAIAIIGQAFLLLIFNSKLPSKIDPLINPDGQFNRYCTASPPPDIYKSSYYPHPYCITDLLGHWVINWQLWWLDLFNTLSVIGIFVLLVAGTYLIINDLAKEESRGTLNFLRLSPRTANNVLFGKILGVPCLVYFLGLWVFPLHLIAGLRAHIPLILILLFYSILIASCAFFFNLSLLAGLINSNLGSLQAFSVSGAVLFFLFVMTGITFSSGDLVSNTPFDWITIFYPGTILSYLAKSTFLPAETIDFDYKDLENLFWYGQPLWRNVELGIAFIFLNYGLWTYWISQALKRRFHNPTATWLSKSNSYWLSASFIILAVGFVFQKPNYGGIKKHIFENFAILQIFIIVFALMLVAALSPHRQTLQDWSRYRHQTEHNRRSLIQDLIFGERSPSTVAIAINLGLILLYLIPAIIIAPLGTSRLWILSGVLLGLNMILIAGIVAQRILLLKTPKRMIIAGFCIIAFMTLPPLCFAFLGFLPHRLLIPWFFSFFPLSIFVNASAKSASSIIVILSVLSQWLMIALAGFEMTKQLQKLGESSTKQLLTNDKVIVNR
ncbi:conserved hypothetical protein [Rippkaea orientalis PCC 8801]|uniref:Uncharacterized protein n=1 Tax=Rippkaea orientalis (strain PCC 8801 / RF-1) TaxID=41431 RepID=B7K175_RIPO1|nr:hypothetical protein [Rippkaea orientalis]ACK66270.1 conserved hypothetical protein [Rippkaea orientalis PCC 8801]